MSEVIKKWYQSNTVWSAILKIAAGVIMLLQQLLTGDIQPQVFVTGLVSAAWGIYDVITRFRTNQPIEIPERLNKTLGGILKKQ